MQVDWLGKYYRTRRARSATEGAREARRTRARSLTSVEARSATRSASRKRETLTLFNACSPFSMHALITVYYTTISSQLSAWQQADRRVANMYLGTGSLTKEYGQPKVWGRRMMATFGSCIKVHVDKVKNVFATCFVFQQRVRPQAFTARWQASTARRKRLNF